MKSFWFVNQRVRRRFEYLNGPAMELIQMNKRSNLKIGSSLHPNFNTMLRPSRFSLQMRDLQN